MVKNNSAILPEAVGTKVYPLYQCTDCPGKKPFEGRRKYLLHRAMKHRLDPPAAETVEQPAAEAGVELIIAEEVIEESDLIIAEEIYS